MSRDAGLALAGALALSGAGMTDDPSPLDRARALAAQADRALDDGQPEQAGDLYDRAVAALGDGYRRAGVIDDTPTRLILARVEAGKGRHEQAARLKRVAVASRLAQATR